MAWQIHSCLFCHLSFKIVLRCQQVQDHEQVLGSNLAACAMQPSLWKQKHSCGSAAICIKMPDGSAVEPIILVEAELEVLIVLGSPTQAT